MYCLSCSDSSAVHSDEEAISAVRYKFVGFGKDP